MEDVCIVINDSDDSYDTYGSIYSSDITTFRRAIKGIVDVKQSGKFLSHHLHFALQFSLVFPSRYRIFQTRLCYYMSI